MDKEYKASARSKLFAAISVVFALFTIVVFLDTCLNPSKADNRIPGMIVMGAVMLIFLILALVYNIKLKDSVLLTDDRVIFRLHQRLKAINEEVRWKDIRNADVKDVEETTILTLTLTYGEVKKFRIDHLDKNLGWDIRFRLSPAARIDDEEDKELKDDKDLVPDGPGTLAWAKKKAFRKVLASAFVEFIGTVLFAFGKRWGIVVVTSALICGVAFLYQYHTFNSLHLNPALVKKGRKTIFLGALLLVVIFAAALIISDANIPPAS